MMRLLSSCRPCLAEGGHDSLGDSSDSSDDSADVDVPALRHAVADDSQLASSEDSSLLMSGSDADGDAAHGVDSDQTSEEALSDELSEDEGSDSEDQAERVQEEGTGALSGVTLRPPQPLQCPLLVTQRLVGSLNGGAHAGRASRHAGRVSQAPQMQAHFSETAPERGVCVRHQHSVGALAPASAMKPSCGRASGGCSTGWRSSTCRASRRTSRASWSRAAGWPSHRPWSTSCSA